jgi:recA bacterial DNA recombination protein
MSSPQVFTQAALGRHFDFVPTDFEFVARDGLCQLARFSEVSKLAGVTPASRLEARAAPEMVSSGIAEIDSLTGGLPRGCLSEICGPASSGRTSLLLAAMAAATKRQEICALVDSSDALNPQSAAAASVNLKQLLWIRCSAGSGRHGRTHRINNFARADEKAGYRAEFSALENVLRVTDLLLQSSGFGLVAIDIGDVSCKVAQRIPLTSWFRFRRAAENTSTVLLVISRRSCAATCASLLLQLKGPLQASGSGLQSPCRIQASAEEQSYISSEFSKNIAARTLPAHAEILEGLHIRAELLRSRFERKPVRSVTAAFATQTVQIS